MAAKTPFHQLPNANQAALRGTTSEFRAFLQVFFKLNVPPSMSKAAELIRAHCGVASRKELDTNPDAARKWDTLKLEFDTWRGRAAKPHQ